MLEAIFGGLIGSLITVIATKIFDLIHEKQKHKYNLQKEFFEKKLTTLDTTVKEWFSMASLLRDFIALYEKLLSEPRMTSEVFNKISNTLSSRLKQCIGDETTPTALSLYFDFPDDIWDSTLFKKYIDSVTSLLISTQQIEVLVDAYKKSIDTEHEKSKFRELEKAGELHKKSIENALVLYKENFKQYKKYIDHARTLMKKYEV